MPLYNIHLKSDDNTRIATLMQLDAGHRTRGAELSAVMPPDNHLDLFTID
jgi:hypothetical protein